MFKKIGTQIKKGKINGFLFFLLISSVFWFLTKFSKEYTASVSSNITYSDLPTNTVLSTTNDSGLSFDLTANGFEFLFFKIKKPIIQINLNKYYNQGNNNVIISDVELRRIITSQLNSNLLVKNVSKQELIIRLNEIISKKVKISPQLDITYQDGFKATAGLKIIPDSIQISGPEEILNEIHTISTKLLKLENVNSSISESIEIYAIDNKDIIVRQENIKLEIEVDEFTQKKLIIPIEIINNDNENTLKITPEVSGITFDVSVSDFKLLTENDFQLVCDYSEKREEDNVIMLKLIKQPTNIFNVELEHKKVNFLIFKETL
jgi:hypothetical protein